MEQTSGGPNQKGKRGVPLWLAIVLGCVILFLALAICLILLLRSYSIRCVPVAPVSSEATPETGMVSPEPPVIEWQTKEPEKPTAEPTLEPTEKPTAEPTPEPTAEPTAEPTSVPDYFMFGGKKIKTGETKINGKNLGINGKKNKLKHIPEEEVQDLVALCPDLEELILDYCFMDDYTPLGGLVKLRELQLPNCGEGSGNAITDIDWVSGLKELTSLNFGHNRISDTAALEGLSKLTWLNLSGNPLTDEDLEPIGKLTNLKKLYLYDLEKITDVEPLENLSKLTFLHIGHNSKLEDVKPLTGLKKLVYLRLNSTKVSDLSGFGNLTSLKKLDLSKCPIKTSTVPELKGCKCLEKIVIEMGDYDTYTAILDLIGEGYPFHFLYNWSDD